MSKLAKRVSTALSNYDPGKGVKKIAFLEMAEKHYARAKDATKLEQAIRQKLESQAEFVFWYDTQANKEPAGRKKKIIDNGSVTNYDKPGQNGLPDSMTISRWRLRLNTPEAFQRSLTSAFEKYRKLLEFATTAHVGQNTGEYEWYTPSEYIEAAREVLGAIDLDPATSEAANAVVKAERYFVEADKAISRDWEGRVWMNPPYSQPLIFDFCTKLAGSFLLGTVPAAVVLVNNATETEWFRTLSRVASGLCLPDGRIRFWSPTKETAAPLQGQAVIYMGPTPGVFVDRFQRFGLVWVKP